MDASAVEERMRSIGQCTVRLNEAATEALVQFEDRAHARTACRCLNNTRVGEVYVTVEACQNRTHLYRVPQRREHTTIFNVAGKPLCRVKSTTDMSPSLSVLSTVEAPDIRGLAQHKSFSIRGATKSDRYTLLEFCRQLHRLNQCAFATRAAAGGFVYIFPAHSFLENLWDVRGGDAIAVDL